jgi:peptidyl-prolyl cis-trans isomerase C
MRFRVRSIWVAVLVLAAVGACGRGQKPTTEGETADRVLARVGDQVIRQRDVDEVRAQLPQHRQHEFEGVRGTMRLVDQLVDRDLMLQAATDAGLDRDPEIVKQMEDIHRSLLLQAYQKKMREALPAPTDDDLHRYFDEHPTEFVIPARINASWIKCATKAEADRARRRVIVKGEKFADVAREVSIDRTTAADGGLLGYFNPTGYIRSVGPDTAFARRAFELEAGDIGDVFPYKDGWAFIAVHEKMTERAEPFDHAVDRIRARLTPTLNDSLVQAELASLRSKYKVEILLDPDKELEGKPADEILRLATESTDPHDRIDYYRALLRMYPKYERADEAQFMIGFMYSEELHDFDKARPEYQKVLSTYPNSDIRNSAQYMLEHMGEGTTLPKFQDPPDEGAGAAPSEP